MATPVSTQAPTRVRYWVIVFAVTLAVITYIDRVCISQAAPLITRDLGLTKEQMGWVFFAFSLAYSLFEIPGGYLGDRETMVPDHVFQPVTQVGVSGRLAEVGDGFGGLIATI